jgi:hypothetical protein
LTPPSFQGKRGNQDNRNEGGEESNRIIEMREEKS